MAKRRGAQRSETFRQVITADKEVDFWEKVYADAVGGLEVNPKVKISARNIVAARLEAPFAAKIGDAELESIADRLREEVGKLEERGLRLVRPEEADGDADAGVA